MQIDPSKLTLGEILDVEEKAGMGINDVLATLPTKGLAALAWVVQRREQPDFSWDAVLQLDVHAVGEVFDKAARNGFGYDEEAGAADPTEISGDGSTST